MSAFASVSMGTVTVVPPNLSGGLAGTLPGAASVGPDGTSQYHIDLPVPPGTAGIVPQIGLHYTSGTPAAMSGLGWSVTGLSEITRCPSTLAQDNGVTLPVSNSATDQFCLDGQRLIMISGTLGGNAEFRTEVESFSRVKSFGGNPDIGPDHWTVETKAGLTMTYGGSTGNATLVSAPRPNDTISRNFSWSIARSQDAHGNYVSYQYEANDGTGEHLPTQIRYTGNDGAGLVPYDAVNFIYGTRWDPYRGWAAGSLFTRSHILQAIETRLQTAADGTGGTLVRHWGLAYTPSTVNGAVPAGTTPSPLARSLLQSIQDCDGTGHCLTPTTFTWTQRVVASEVISGGGGSNWGGPQLTLTPPDLGRGTNRVVDQIERTVLPIDVNGDGKTDLLYATNNGNWQLCINAGSAFSCNTLASMPKFDSGTFVPGDFNGDGKMDVLIPPASAGGTVGQLCLSFGTGFTCNPVTVPARIALATTNNYVALDVSGDGRDDLIVVGNGAPPATDSYICLATGTTLRTCTDVGASVLGSGLDSVDDGTTRAYRLTGDFDGDGRMDALSYNLDDRGTMDSGAQHISDHTMFQIFYGSPTGFTRGPGGSTFPAYRPAYPQQNPLADTNGDGYTDFIWGGAGDRHGVGPVGYFTTCNLTGGSTDCNTTTLPGGANDLRAGPYDFADYDGTGVPVAMHGTGTFPIDPTTGVPGAISPWTSGTSVPCANAAGGVIGDFNGDGLPDGACYDSVNKIWAVTFNGGAGSYPDLLQTVTDGNGLTSRFSYKGLADPTVYTNGSATVLPAKDVHGGQPVVSTLAVDAASSVSTGTTLNTNYSYSGLRTDVTRRQSLGFETVTALDVPTGVKTVTQYSQAFPTIGMPVQVTTSTTARTLSLTTQINQSFSTYPGVLFPYLDYSHTAQWDLDGTALPTRGSEVNSIDAWGNVTMSTDGIGDSANAETFTTTTTSQFQNNAATWQIGQLTDTVVMKTAPGAANVAREVAFTYDAFGQLATQTNQPNEPALKLAITYTHDPNFGIITKQTQAWTDPLTSAAMSRDALRTVYTDPAFRFPSTIYNALNQGTSYTYDMSLGQPLSVIDVNSLTTTFAYDGFGRKTRQGLPDGTSTTWAYKTCVDTCGMAGTATSVTITQHWANIGGTDQQSVEPSEVFHDALGRDVMSRTWNYAEAAVYADQLYNNAGNLSGRSNPQTAADRSSGLYGSTTYPSYDAKHRPLVISTTNSDNSGSDTTNITYSGLATTTQDANGHTTSRRLNGLGKVRQVTDAMGHTTIYGYDGFGNVVQTTDPLGNVNSIQLDHMGHKIVQSDLDLGHWTYVVDARGLVRSQTDAKGQVTTISCDMLDRVTERLEPDLDSRWSFDTASNGVGKLAESYTWIAASGTKDYRRVYSYDSLSRRIAATTTLDWDYAQLQTYDAFGRVATVTHRRSAVGAANVANNPTGTGGGSKFVPIPIDDDLTIIIPVSTNVGTGQFGLPEIQYTLAYNNQGDVSSVMRGATTLWTLNAQDARGRTQLETFGSGLMTATGYNAYTGRLEAIQTGTGNGSGGVNATIQADAYGYDAVGNLTGRNWLPATAAAAMSETFTYDPLYRLQTSQVGGLDVKNFTYDAIGNITSKTNVGSYNYPAANTARPHMLNNIVGTVVGQPNPSFTYDANGNTQSGLNRWYAWSAANLPVSVDQLSDGTQASATLRHEFLYGPDRQRTREIVRAMSGTTIGAAQHTIYSAGAIEKEIDAVAGTTKIRTYLPLGLGYTEEVFTGTSIVPSSAGTPAERYFHKDNLGSLVIVTDASQAVLQRMAYDAWGRRRQSNGLEVGWQYLGAQSAANALDHTGYTDQEQLDDLSLVHLNGRVYDPMTGRMTSPDPTIPDAYDLQSLNRASYVLNAPLGATDPSGYLGITTEGDVQRVITWGEHLLGSDSLSFSPQQWETAVRIYSDAVRIGRGLNTVKPLLVRILVKRGTQELAVQGCAAATGGACEVLTFAVVAGTVYDLAKITPDAISAISQALNADGEAGTGSASPTGANSESPTASPPPEGDDGGKKKEDPKDGKKLKKLSDGEIKSLKDDGVDIHELKGKNSSLFDLYKDSNGDVYQLLKRGRGEPNPTGINIKGW